MAIASVSLALPRLESQTSFWPPRLIPATTSRHSNMDSHGYPWQLKPPTPMRPKTKHATQDPPSDEAPLNHGAVAPPQQETPAPSTDTPTARPSRYRKRWFHRFCLIAVYFLVQVVPWAMTCLLTVRPINHPSYIDQTRRYSTQDMASISRIFKAVGILNTIATTATTSIISALLAQPAVVHVQRHEAGWPLKSRQTFALADQGWSNPLTFWKSLRKDGMRLKTTFPWWSAAFFQFSIAQHPLHAVLVTTVSIQVPYCGDSPSLTTEHSSSCDTIGNGSSRIGYDPQPVFLVNILALLVMDKLESGRCSRSICSLSGSPRQSGYSSTRTGIGWNAHLFLLYCCMKQC